MKRSATIGISRCISKRHIVISGCLHVNRIFYPFARRYPTNNVAFVSICRRIYIFLNSKITFIILRNIYIGYILANTTFKGIIKARFNNTGYFYGCSRIRHLFTYLNRHNISKVKLTAFKNFCIHTMLS